MAHLIQSNPTAVNRNPRRNVASQPDMTPMVDLAFLLVTFFVLTTSMLKPKALEIFYPKEEGVPLKANNALTLLLGEGRDNIFWYYGEFRGDQTDISKVDYSTDGLRNILLEYNRSVTNRLARLELQFNKRDGRSAEHSERYAQLAHDIFNADEALVVVVKTLPRTKFSEVIAAIDELNICNVRKRVVQDMNRREEEIIKDL
jgi:hypothetical protein